MKNYDPDINPCKCLQNGSKTKCWQNFSETDALEGHVPHSSHIAVPVCIIFDIWQILQPQPCNKSPARNEIGHHVPFASD